MAVLVRCHNAVERFGWWLMGLPTGIREPWRPLLRWGPYRWGAWLSNRFPADTALLDAPQRSITGPM